MEGQEHACGFVHSSCAASETSVVKDLFLNSPLKTRSSCITKNPYSLQKNKGFSWNTGYVDLTKRRRTESDPDDPNQKWLRGQSPPPLYNTENETPACIIKHNLEAKYIDEDCQTKTGDYSHSYRSSAAFDQTEEEGNKRPVDHCSPTNCSKRTELATAGRQLVNYGPRSSPPLPRRYYRPGRSNDKADASATCLNVPNNFAKDKSTAFVATRDLKAQNIPSRTISENEPTGFAAQCDKEAQHLPRPLEMNRNMNDTSLSIKRKREKGENFQTLTTPAKPLIPIERNLIAITQDSPHGRTLQTGRDLVSNSVQENDILCSSQIGRAHV